jgi:hypothetical protein
MLRPSRPTPRLQHFSSRLHRWWQAPYWSLAFSIDPDALLVNADPLFTAHRELLVTLAGRYRLPWGLMLRSS